MGAFLAVSKGSVEPPWLLEVKYTGGDPTSQPLALVGKGKNKIWNNPSLLCLTQGSHLTLVAIRSNQQVPWV